MGLASRWRRLPAAAGAAGAAFVLLTGAVSFGLRLSPLRLLPAFPRIRGLDYSPEPFRGVAPLRASFLEEVLGKANLAALLGAGGSSAPESRPPPPSQPGPAPSPSPSPRPRLLSPIIPPSGVDLRISMTADRETVRAGEDIVYTIMVRNAGDADFMGEFTIEAHVPFGTTFTDPGPCAGPDPPNPCIYVPAPVPGPPTDRVHTVVHSASVPIRAGEEYLLRYRVTVNETALPGNELTNHAHLFVPPDERRATSNAVIVRVQ